VNLSRVVIERSGWLGKRLERRDEGSWSDLQNLREIILATPIF